MHVILVGSVIVTAVGNELVIAGGHGPASVLSPAVVIGGAALFLVGNGCYKRVVYTWFPLSHWIGLALLVGVALGSPWFGLAGLNVAVTVVLVLTALLETRSRGRTAAKRGRAAKGDTPG